MAFMTELLVDDYGFLFGGEEVFPVDVTEHDWRTPYPRFDATASFEREAGTLGSRPDVFRHPEIRDWVCDEAAWSVLSSVAPSDVRLTGQGRLGTTRMYAVQVVAILDVVDLESSEIDDYGSYQVVRFPAFHRSASVSQRVFRIPGSYTDLFVGSAVKGSLDDEGITGLGYTPVPVTG
jgi:hypothetical protein